MIQRFQMAYWLFRLMNPKPTIHEPAKAKLMKMGQPAAKRVLKLAKNAESHPFRVGALILKPNYQAAMSYFPPAEQTKRLQQYLDGLAKAVVESRATRIRCGEILAFIGLPAWEMMLELAAKYPQTDYVRTAYYLIPQFIGHIPVELFITASRHPVAVVATQAAQSLMTYNRDELTPDTALEVSRAAMASLRAGFVSDQLVLNDALMAFAPAMVKFGQSGIDALANCWESSNKDLQRVAMQTMLTNDLRFLNTFLNACFSADPTIRLGGIKGLSLLLWLPTLPNDKFDLATESFVAALEQETYSEARAGLLCQLVGGLRQVGDFTAIRPLEAFLASLPAPEALPLTEIVATSEEEYDDDEPEEAILEQLRQLTQQTIEKLRFGSG